MAELLSKDDFRAALDEAIKGREAKNASFSMAWATGELKREHFARWAENHYHYRVVAPISSYGGRSLIVRTQRSKPRTAHHT